jgi:hypothetical protein
MFVSAEGATPSWTLARINERSSRSFQTEPFWYRFGTAVAFQES